MVSNKENRISSERLMLPQDIREHLIEARGNGFAGGGEYVSDVMIPGFNRFKFQDPGNRYYYEDRYATPVGRPWVIDGFELLTRTPGGSRLSRYSYAGGLTQDGFEQEEEKKKDPEKKIIPGEEIIFDRLRKGLFEKRESARLCESISHSFDDKYGRWVFRTRGQQTNFGWIDNEELFLDTKILHKLTGMGISYQGINS